MHFDDVLAANVDTIFVDGHSAGFERTLSAKIHLVVQLDVDGLAIFRNSSGDIAIPMDANGTAQILFNVRLTTGIGIIRRQPEAAALLGINDAPFHQDQLFFRGCPMAGTKPGHIQGCVGQPGEAVDAGEIFGQLQLQTIGRSHHADIGTSGQTIFIRHAPVNLQSAVQSPAYIVLSISGKDRLPYNI